MKKKTDAPGDPHGPMTKLFHTPYALKHPKGPATITVDEAIGLLQKLRTGTGIGGASKLTVWTGPELFQVKDITIRGGNGKNRITLVLADKPFFSLNTPPRSRGRRGVKCCKCFHKGRKSKCRGCGHQVCSSCRYEV